MLRLAYHILIQPTYLFQRLTDNVLVVNPYKCHFGQSSEEYLGHVIDAEGCRPLPEKVKAATNFPYPTSKRQTAPLRGDD